MIHKFISIVVYAKDVTCDWRSFITCSDGDNVWEIRGYGSTVVEAVSVVWDRFNAPDDWDLYGEIIDDATQGKSMNIEKYMDIARVVSQLSKDETKVGAITIGPSKEIRSLGYNGAPRGCEADEDERRVRPEKYYWFSHAELNAITNAARVGTPLDGCSMLVTHYPCMDCARAIVQAGIKRLVVAQMADEFKERWKDHIERSTRLFDECDVKVEILNER